MDETMNCYELRDQLDDYVDDALPAAEREALDAHVEGCAACRQRLASEQNLRRLLANYGDTAVPVPDAAWFDRALATAAADGRRESRNRWFMTGAAASLVAALSLLLVLGGGPDLPTTNDELPLVTMTVAQPQTVNLVFSAQADLADARVTLLLPPGVALAGFGSQREVSWTTSLRAGRNLLPLRLVGELPGDGELEAILEHGEDDRAFRVRVRVI